MTDRVDSTVGIKRWFHCRMLNKHDTQIAFVGDKIVKRCERCDKITAVGVRVSHKEMPWPDDYGWAEVQERK